MKFVYKSVIILFVLLMSLSFVSAANDTSADSGTHSTITKEGTSAVESNSIVKSHDANVDKGAGNTSVKTVKIKANNVKTYSGENYTFKATVVDENNKAVPDGKFVIKFNGKTHITTTIKNGKLNYEYVMPNYSAKNYTLQYVYVQNDKYGRYELNKTLTLMKRNSSVVPANVSNLTPVTIAAGAVETCAGHTVLFNGIVFDDKGMPVSEGKVVIKLNGKAHVTTYIKNNRFDYEYVMPKYSAKEYKLQYVYVQNDKYARYELNTTLKIFKNNYHNIPFNSTTVIADDVVSYKNDFAIFSGKVFDSNNNPVSGGTVHLKINGRTIQQIGVNNGSFQSKVEVNYSPKNYLITYVYAFNFESSLRSETNRLLTVIKKTDPKKTGVIIKANDIDTVLGTTLRVNGIVTDENGKAVKNGTIQIKILNASKGLGDTSKVIGTINVFYGKFSGNVNIPLLESGNYSMQYIYVQNDYYGRYELNRKISLSKQNTTLLIYDENDYVIQEDYSCLKIYKYQSALCLKVVGATDGRIAESGKLGSKINGKTCCDKNGNPLITQVCINPEFPDDALVLILSLPKNIKVGSINNITFTFSGNDYMNELRYTTQFILL